MTNKEIIEAAFRAWGREFYFKTSLSQVARELKVSKPALYRHFINKQALLDAMAKHFFDDFTAFIREDYKKALNIGDSDEGISIFVRSIAEYYARNVNIFIFLMIKLHNRKLDENDMTKELGARGIDMENFYLLIKKDYIFHPPVVRLINATLIFFIADFHKKMKSTVNPPSEEEIAKIIAVIGEILGAGLCYSNEEIAALDYEGLESRVAGTMDNTEDDPLLKAAASAVAEAGPWGASMERVAHCSGLSKSSLYCHFKNKQDMLRKLFLTEFSRIFDFARRGMGQSAVPLEQLYLGIFSIAEYLRSKPVILVAMDWIRNRGINLKSPGNKPKSMPEFMRLFEGIGIKPLRDGKNPFDGLHGEGVWITPWILFLIINMLMQKRQEKAAGDALNDDIRFLYRLITLGIGGFKK